MGLVCHAFATLSWMFMPSLGCALPDDPETTAEVRAYIDVSTELPILNPIDGEPVDSILVDLDRIEVHRVVGDPDEREPYDASEPSEADAADDEGWVTIYVGRDDGTDVYDLLDLDDLPAELATTRLPEGRYDGLRMVIDEAWIVVDGATRTLEIPSADASGLKVESTFCLDAGSFEELYVEWDLDGILHHTRERGYWLTPVIHIEAPPTCIADMR